MTSTADTVAKVLPEAVAQAAVENPDVKEALSGLQNALRSHLERRGS